MAFKLFPFLLGIGLLNACAVGDTWLFEVCGASRCQNSNSKNPYVSQIKDTRRNMSMDQAFAILGDPEFVTQTQGHDARLQVKPAQIWEYKSDEYISNTPGMSGERVNGFVKMTFIDDKLIQVQIQERKSIDHELMSQPRILEAINKGERENDTRVVRKVLLDQMKGSACNGKVAMEINIKTAHRLLTSKNGVGQGHYGLIVTGTIKANTNGAQSVATPVEGYFDLMYGFLHVSSTNPRMTLEMARDAKGQGWAGIIVSEQFNTCPDMALVSSKGIVTNTLPPLTGNLAFKESQRLYPKNAITNQYDAYDETIAFHWMDVAVQLGNDDVYYEMGQYYEQKSKQSPDNARLALQFYKNAAQKANDVRAQKRLAKLYEEGQGTAVDRAEARRWNNLAKTTIKHARQLCNSQPSVTTMVQIVNQQRLRNAILSAVMEELTDFRANQGELKLSRISVKDVISLNKPFVCVLEGKRKDASVGIADDDGDEYHAAYDAAYVQEFRMEPIGATLYGLSANDRQRSYYTKIEIK